MTQRRARIATRRGETLRLGWMARDARVHVHLHVFGEDARDEVQTYENEYGYCTERETV